jgi:XTP/dITP diphosphohydrolase
MIKKKVFIATFNEGKIQRFKKLIDRTGLEVEVYTPADLDLEDPNIEETGTSLAENAEIKARAFFGKVAMPILSNDTGFWVEGEGLVQTPKRSAFGTRNENSMSKEEAAKRILDFWKEIAGKYGGQVNAAWIEAFFLLDPDGKVHQTESRREVILTNQEFGEPHIQLPIRALYISRASGKPALQQSEEEDLLELQPVTDALHDILSKATSGD